jgi:hypothetical protein
MFNKLAYFKCVSLIMLAGKVFVDDALFSWFDIFGMVLIPAVFTVLLSELDKKLDSWTTKVDGKDL